MIIEAGVCSLGFVAGLAASMLSRRISSRLGDCTFWQRVLAFAKNLLRTDQEVHIFREYALLFPLLLRYVVRKSAILIIAMSPITVGFVGLTSVATHAAPIHAQYATAQESAISDPPKRDRAIIWDYFRDWEFNYLGSASMASLFGLLLTKYRL